MKQEIKNWKTLTVYWRFCSLYKTMLSCCLKCRKGTESKNPKVSKTKNGRIMLLWKSEVCDKKKSKLITEQEADGLKYYGLNSTGIKTSFS